METIRAFTPPRTARPRYRRDELCESLTASVFRTSGRPQAAGLIPADYQLQGYCTY